jgi:hypothetical protein
MPTSSRARRARITVVLALLGLTACQAGQARPRCPSEVSKPGCLTEEVCEYDRGRDCFVCHCAPPAYYPPRFDPRPSAKS